jgi:anti-sigma-K factor RskA
LNVNGSDLSDLIPAYTLGALDPEERAEFEAWLQHHPEVQATLADYQALADWLVTAVPGRRAPDHLQADLRQRLATGGSPVAGPHQLATAEHAPVELPAQTKRGRTRIRFWLAAAAVFALVVLGVVVVWQVTRPGSKQTNLAKLYAKIQAEQGAAQYEIVPGEGQETVGGNLVVSSRGDQAVICVWKLPVLEPDQTFQLWLLDAGGTLRSGGLFRASESSNATYIVVPLDKPISDFQRFGVSIEPVGGSPLVNQPSGPVVFRVSL